MSLLAPKAIIALVVSPFIMHSHYANGSWNHQNISMVCSCHHADFVENEMPEVYYPLLENFYMLMSKSKSKELHQLTTVRMYVCVGRGYCILTLFCFTPFLISVFLHTLANVVLKGQLQ